MVKNGTLAERVANGMRHNSLQPHHMNMNSLKTTIHFFLYFSSYFFFYNCLFVQLCVFVLGTKMTGMGHLGRIICLGMNM